MGWASKKLRWIANWRSSKTLRNLRSRSSCPEAIQTRSSHMARLLVDLGWTLNMESETDLSGREDQLANLHLFWVPCCPCWDFLRVVLPSWKSLPFSISWPSFWDDWNLIGYGPANANASLLIGISHLESMIYCECGYGLISNKIEVLPLLWAFSYYLLFLVFGMSIHIANMTVIHAYPKPWGCISTLTTTA